MGYAKHIGRVGALAVALGIGAAVATTPGVVWAQPDSSSADGEAPSTTDPSPTTPDEETPSAPETTAPSGSDPGAVDPAVVADTTTTTSGTQSTTVIGGGDEPTVVISGQSTSAGGPDVIAEPGDTAPVAQQTPGVSPPAAAPAPLASRAPAPISSGIPNAVSAFTAVATSPLGVDNPAAPADAPAARVLPAVFAAAGVADQVSASRSTEFSALDAAAPAAAPDPISTLLATPLSFVAMAVSSVVDAFASIVGPGAPLENAALFAVLAWARRQSNQSLANQTPTLSPQQTSQDLDDRQVHGSFGPADPDADALTYTVPASGAGAPAHGDVTIDQAARTWTYTPDTGYSGADSFTVTASDEASGFHVHAPGQTHTAIATVDVDVAPPAVTNHPPQQGDPGFVVDDVDQRTGVVTGHVNVSDPDAGDTLTYALANPIDPAIGVVDVDETTGGWTFTPEPQARLDAYTLQGDDEVDFTVVATDGQATTPVSVSAPVDPAEAVETGTIAVGNGASGIAVSGGRVYVTNSSDGTVTVIDTATNSVVDTNPTTPSVTEPITVGNQPGGVAVNPDGNRIYVANYIDDTVTVIDYEPTTNTYTVVDTNPSTAIVDPIATGLRPTGVAVSPDGGRIYVTNQSGGSVTVIDYDTATDTYTVADPILVSNPTGVAVSPDGSRIYVTNEFASSVAVIDYDSATDTYTVVDTNPANPGSDPITVGNIPIGVAVGPDGDRIYVTNRGDDTVAVIDYDSATDTYTVADPITVGNDPVGLAVIGDRVYVANGGETTMSVIDVATNTVVETVLVGDAPVGVVAHGDRIYVVNSNDSTMSVITSAHDGPELIPNEDGTFDMVLQYGGDGEFEDVTIPAAGEPGAPSYWRVVSQTYNSETGEFEAVLEPTLAGQLIVGQGTTLNDSFTLQATPANEAGPATFSTFALRAAPDTFAAAAAADPGPSVPLPQPPGATLNIVEDAIVVGDAPAGTVVTDKYAYVMNYHEDGTVTVIDADPMSPTYNTVITTIDVGDSPAFAALAGDRLYVVNSASSEPTGTPATVTVIDTNTNTVIDADPSTPEVDTIDLVDQYAFMPTASPDGTRVYVVNPLNGTVSVIDTDNSVPNSPTYNTVVEVIRVAPASDPYDPSGGYQLGAGTFNEDGTIFYVPRIHAMVVESPEGAHVEYDSEVMVIDTDPDNAATYNTVRDLDPATTDVLDGIQLQGVAPGLGTSNGDRLYLPAWDMESAQQNPSGYPSGSVTVIDIDPDSPTYHSVIDGNDTTGAVDGIPAGTMPLNMSVSPDGSVAYVVNAADGTVTVIDTVTNKAITTFTYDSTPSAYTGPNLLAVSPNGKQMYITKYSDGTVTSVSIV